MPSRLLNSIVFAGIFAIGVSSAQQGFTGVLVPRMENLYPGIIACGSDGQVYFPSIGYEYFVLRVSPDGSSLTFRLPDKTYYAEAVAPYPDGVNILLAGGRKTLRRGRVIFHFDNQGNLLTQHSVSTDLVDAMMATTSSHTPILVGHHQADSSQREDWKYGGVVLDADDRVINRFELPLPPAGGTWTFGPNDRRLMTAGDSAAYVLLHSNEPLATAIATISETGSVNIKTVPEPIFDDQRYHKWLVGPGVAVEMYYVLGERSTHHFDEYDLKSGKKIASKIAPFQAECYYGNTVIGLDRPNTLRLRIARLQ